MGARDEVLEIAFPTRIVVREEQDVGSARRRDPARKMDGADVAEEARTVESAANSPTAQNTSRDVNQRMAPGLRCVIEIMWFCA